MVSCRMRFWAKDDGLSRRMMGSCSLKKIAFDVIFVMWLIYYFKSVSRKHDLFGSISPFRALASIRGHVDSRLIRTSFLIQRLVIVLFQGLKFVEHYLGKLNISSRREINQDSFRTSLMGRFQGCGVGQLSNTPRTASHAALLVTDYQESGCQVLIGATIPCIV